MGDIKSIFYDKANEIKNIGRPEFKDLTTNCIKQRWRALDNHYTPSFQKKYKDIKFFDLHYTHVNLMCPWTYDDLDFDYNLGTAAAIWVLDELKRTGKLDEANITLPKDYRKYIFMEMPEVFSHPCYSTELVRATMAVLKNRNGGTDRKFFVDKYAEKGTKADNNDRERADALLSLISKSRIDEACRHFKGKMAEIEDCLFEVLLRLQRDVEVKEKTLKENDPVQSSSFGISPLSDLRTREQLGQFNEAYKNYINCVVGFGKEITKTYEENLKKYKIVKVAKLLRDFTVDDPFEICFALLYLLDNGDEAPWLYGTGAALMCKAGSLLPWFTSPEDFLEKTGYKEYTKWDYNRRDWASNKDKEREDTLVKANTFFEKKFKDRTMGQYFYQLTGTMIPRGLHPFEFEKDMFLKEGMDSSDVEMLIGLSEYAFLREFQNDLPPAEIELMPQEHSKVDSEGNNKAEEESLDDLEYVEKNNDEPEEDKTQQLKTEIRFLREALYKANRDNNKVNLQLEQEREQNELEHRELADLRSLIFNQQQETEEKPKYNITYPYMTRHRIVVVGGHESFLKAIVPMFPKVKFIRADELEDILLIRNADVVWFQTNCMSHKQYYRIVDAAKKHGVMIRYFSYSSADKCAEQIVLEDEK